MKIVVVYGTERKSCTYSIAQKLVGKISYTHIKEVFLPRDLPEYCISFLTRESFFKTLKYRCGYPKIFTSIEHARNWFADFINWYNTSHMHSGLQYVTPIQKRKGLHHAIFENRNEVIAEAKKKHPARWGKRDTKKYVAPSAEVLNEAKNEVA